MLPTTPKMAKEEGKKYYFTGLPCKFGHIEMRYTNGAKCVECSKILSLKRSKLPYVKEKIKLLKQKNKKPQKTPMIVTTSKDEKERKREYARKYYHLKKDHLSLMSKKYYNSDERKKYIKNWAREYRKTPIGASISFMRKCINRCLINKSDRTSVLLGYEKENLRSHLEEKFKDGMSWENYGKWHIDHIIPIKHFLDKNINDPKIINALDNLQPLWAEENLTKSSRMDF